MNIVKRILPVLFLFGLVSGFSQQQPLKNLPDRVEMQDKTAYVGKINSEKSVKGKILVITTKDGEHSLKWEDIFYVSVFGKGDFRATYGLSEGVIGKISPVITGEDKVAGSSVREEKKELSIEDQIRAIDITIKILEDAGKEENKAKLIELRDNRAELVRQSQNK